MGFDLSSVLKDVSKMDTGAGPEGREQIEYIDIDKIYPDPNNFYSINGIEQLAANIELCGLQQPIRVRPDADGIGYWIVSGHRRYSAIKMLHSEGGTQWLTVPCIVETELGSAALRELRLIYANSDSRRMSSADLSKQAERVEALLYKLKEEGFEFPGRMRDHVAEACKVSATKLARIKVIRDGLDEGIKPHWESGDLNESVAYTMAQMPIETQRNVFQLLGNGKYGARAIIEWRVKETAELMAKKQETACKKCGGNCTHWWTMMEKIANTASYTYAECGDNACCENCKSLATCSVCCPELKAKQKELKAKLKEECRSEKEKLKAVEASNRAFLEDLGTRFKAAKAAADISQDTYISSPFEYMGAHAVKIIVENCKTLDCSADYLLGLSDELKRDVSKMDTDIPWKTGRPTVDGWYLLHFTNGNYDALPVTMGEDDDGGWCYDDLAPVKRWLLLETE